MATPTWQTRELPILEAIAELEGDPRLSGEMLAERTGLPNDSVGLALKALADADMIKGQDISTHAGFGMILIRLREKGRRAVGQWPSGDLADELVQLLQARAEASDDPEERGRLQALAHGALDVGKGTLSEVLAALVKHSTGLP